MYLRSDDRGGRMLERLVAAIHGAAGTSVAWNERIDGRQFDVVMRHKNGLHDYLTVIECKDLNRRVSVADVDAFATKSRDAGANKAVANQLWLLPPASQPRCAADRRRARAHHTT